MVPFCHRERAPYYVPRFMRGIQSDNARSATRPHFVLLLQRLIRLGPYVAALLWMTELAGIKNPHKAGFSDQLRNELELVSKTNFKGRR
jgi:hypothetical protein